MSNFSRALKRRGINSGSNLCSLSFHKLRRHFIFAFPGQLDQDDQNDEDRQKSKPGRQHIYFVFSDLNIIDDNHRSGFEVVYACVPIYFFGNSIENTNR